MANITDVLIQPRGTGGTGGFYWNSNDGEAIQLSYYFPDHVEFAIPQNAAQVLIGLTSFGFDGAQEQATLAAMNRWEEVAQVQFVSASGPEAANVLLYNAWVSPRSAETHTFRDAAGVITRHVVANVSEHPENLLLNDGQVGLRNLLHELGHVLGFKHPGKYQADDPGPYLGSGEFAAISDDQRRSVISDIGFGLHVGAGRFAATPLLIDIAAAQLVFGPNMLTRVGNGDVYQFSSSTLDIEAIWDAGGTGDKIDASNQSAQLHIDLRPGSLSSIGPSGIGSDNIAIAYGAVIEDATGGSRSDVIIGNATSNVLEGRAGNDTISGLEGADRLEGGDGNDTLIGGQGDDVLVGGTGDDVYVWSVGDGNDQIVEQPDADGVVRARIVLRDSGYDINVLGPFVPVQGAANTWKLPGTEIVLTHSSPWVLNMPGGGTIELGDGFAIGDFGIQVIDVLPGLPSPGREFMGDLRPLGSYLELDPVTGEMVWVAPDTLVYDEFGNVIGDPSLVSENQSDVFHGSPGSDGIYGEGGNDRLFGEDGDDLIFGGAGFDYIEGGIGNDVITGFETASPGDMFFDELHGGEGNDRIFAGAILSLDEAILMEGPTIWDNGGSSSLYGEEGDDVLVGSSHFDSMSGGSGNDLLIGGRHRDQLSGDDGDDILYAGVDGAFMVGGVGNDTLIANEGALVGSHLHGGTSGYDPLDGNDVLIGNKFGDYIQGGAGSDLIFAGDGNDVFEDDFWAYFDSDQIHMGGGNDYVSASHGDDLVHGGDGDDTLVGHGGNDLMYGGSGNDLLDGGWQRQAAIDPGNGDPFEYVDIASGNDSLYGEDGDDRLAGGEGDDYLVGGRGSDLLEGGPGGDAYVFDVGDGFDTINDFDQSLPGQDTLYFGSGITPDNITLLATPIDNRLFVLFENAQDRIVIPQWFVGNRFKIESFVFADGTAWGIAEIESNAGSDGPSIANDLLVGTSGNDLIHGLEGDDQISDSAGNDILYGDEGRDVIIDNGGHNLLIGGAGRDFLRLNGAPIYDESGEEEIGLVGGSPGSFAIGGGDGDGVLVDDHSVVAYNEGDGDDSLRWTAGNVQKLTISLGGGLSTGDVHLSHLGFRFLLNIGPEIIPEDEEEFVTQPGISLPNLLAQPSLWPAITLQIIGQDIRSYDFNAVVETYLDELAGDPDLTYWSAAQALQANLVEVSTTHALGGAIAYQYATTGSVDALTPTQIHAVLGDAAIGLAAQEIEASAENSAPVLASAIADQSTNEDVAYSFAVPAGTFLDPDVGDLLSYTAARADGSPLPDWISFDAQTQTFSGTPLQADVGAIDVTVTATDGGGLSAEDTFTLTVVNVNDAPVVSAANAELLLNDSTLASSLFSVFDEDGQSPTQYQFYDDVAGGGYFAVNGVEQGAAAAIPVPASDLANTQYVAGSTPGIERVWARAYDGAAWSAWKSWNMTSALHIPNAAPEATPTAATQTVLLDQAVAASSLFSVTDADGDPAARYEFFDSTEGNGHFTVNGVEQGVNVAIPVSAADLANTQFVGASSTGSDRVWVRATDGQTFGAWKSWTMNSWPHATNAAPVADAPNAEVLRNQAVLAQSLFSVTDADGDTIARYEFWDDTAGGGYFALDGVAQSNNPIPVAAAELAELEYVGGAETAVERVWVRANDGMQWGAWESWNMTTALHIPNAAPEATPAATTQTVLLGQAVDASSLFSVTDADGDLVARYEFFDSTEGGGHFTVNGVEQGVNVAISVVAADLASTQFVGGSSTGSDRVWVRATDGQSFGAWKSWTMNSWPHLTNAAPVADGVNTTVISGDSVAAATLFTVSDADGDAPVRYEFWDDVNGGGYWQVKGVQQVASAAIAVDATDLANTEYVGGANTGSERVWVRVNDGMQWGAWESWTMNSWPHLTNAAPVATASSTTILLEQSVAAATLFSVTDADGDAITQYQFFDSTAGNGHFTVNGVEQGVNVAIDVTAAQLADTALLAGSATGSDTVWVRAHDGMAWGAWKSWTMNSWPHLTNAAPVVSATNAGILANEALSASMFFGVSDADGDAATAYQFWDDVNGGGYWALEGVQQASASAIAVSAADLADLDYVGGANPGTERVWARASDGMGWGAWKSWFMSTEGGMLRGGEGPDTLNGGAGPTVLQGGAGNDTLTDTDGDNLFSGGEGDDTMTGGDGDDLFAGGSGNDVVNTGGGSNVIAYNAGGGIDTVYAGAGAANTLSFGGGIGYDDLSLSKEGNDLIVSAGANDQVVLKDWYSGSQSVLNLQIILDASDEFDASSSDPLYNKKVQTFDFLGMVGAFDDALAQSPGLTSWAVTNALLAFHLSGADDLAIGGDLAYWYGKNNGFTGISLAAAQQVIGGAGFGSDAQSLQPFSGLQEGYVKLA